MILKEAGKLVYHLPLEFSKERPLFLFTTEKHESSIDEHPVLKNLPKLNTEKPTIHPVNSASFRPHTRGPNSPEAFGDWLCGDIPQMAIHVVKFNDATTITVTLLHTLTDLLGVMAFYRAWLQVLHGQEDQIAQYIGYRDKDPLESLQTEKTPPRYIYANRILSKWGLFLFGIRDWWDRFWYPKATLRFFSLPGKFVNKLVESARAELLDSEKAVDGEEKLFISDSDVLCAWWTRLLVKANQLSTNRTVCVTNRVDCRDILAKMGLLPSTNTSFIGNCAYSAHCMLPAGLYWNRGYPLGLLANQIRNSIKVHREVEQLQAQDAAFRESICELGRLPIYGESDMMVHGFTNVHKARLYNMDFGPAVADQTAREKRNTACPYFITFSGMDSPKASRNSSAILGRTPEGDWWMSSRMRDDVWARMGEIFATF